ncbi:MOSC domain-containing protein [Staphylococcus aureus]|uniref:MOSC domain-containing protein n=1 Tax=Staphylococcus aureus TaxID=1280 RepID=A0A2X2JR40_STAAU|nr:MOSC domain-containing protein [Staphylococcus aureus]
MISIHAISTGKIQDLPYSSKRPMRSALDKTKISQTTWLSSTGFTGDEQAYKDHGGPHKAVCGLVNITMHCIKMIYLHYLLMRCLERI